ncbi:uncharacterized protein K452DRAFT_323054 [Aplosporella prunicola CBS 121167]|uniref:Uncharacterized protein n=1 Tax=Aplosporella prunicola CBS 121167 TaxID=1176127 RepID=A0A6A6ATV7_9PEZI|nr:uncharacterized protein K452DRAFT_323054 [Aplosporella prunicola CBS 121167]KAF2135442.1 hypothetical protein K452DRAFT_323054 [Aplosporella prunicola CBS 121167]
MTTCGSSSGVKEVLSALKVFDDYCAIGVEAGLASIRPATTSAGSPDSTGVMAPRTISMMDSDAETDYSPTFTPASPPSSIGVGVPDDDAKSTSLTPRLGQTYMIRSVASGAVITLVGGDIVLALPDGHASHWVCAEADSDGWLGFCNAVSGRFLGRDSSWSLSCYATRFRGWEKFRVRERPRGGCVLLMTSWRTLRPVGMNVENGKGKSMLAMIENWDADELIWEFVKV